MTKLERRKKLLVATQAWHKLKNLEKLAKEKEKTNG